MWRQGETHVTAGYAEVILSPMGHQNLRAKNWTPNSYFAACLLKYRVFREAEDQHFYLHWPHCRSRGNVQTHSAWKHVFNYAGPYTGIEGKCPLYIQYQGEASLRLLCDISRSMRSNLDKYLSSACLELFAAKRKAGNLITELVPHCPCAYKGLGPYISELECLQGRESCHGYYSKYIKLLSWAT